ncbi:MAG: Ig-like domain-containing protein [Cyanobacteria bacterium J06650_10]
MMTTLQEAFDYDSDGIDDLINTYTFDADNGLTSLAIDYDVDGAPDIVYTYTYDTSGNLTSESTSFSIFGTVGINPINNNIVGNVTTAPLSYDVVTNSTFDVGSVTTSISDANGVRASVSVSYIDQGDDFFEERLTVIDENGRLVNFLSSRGAIQSFFYNDDGQLVRQISGFSDNPGVTTTFTYDAFGNLASEAIDFEPDGIIDELNIFIEGADAIDDAVVTAEDAVLNGNVFSDNGNGADTSPDGGALAITEVNDLSSDVGNQIVLPSGALLTLNSDGTFIYDPNSQFDFLNAGDSATDSFTYTTDSGNGLPDVATVTVTLNGVSDSIAPTFWFSPDNNSDVGGVKDIVFFDGSNFSLFFDGAAAGLNAKIDAFDIISETEVLISFNRETTLNGLAVDDSDVVKFTADALGAAATAGTFELYLNGSDLGLTRGKEDIDALQALPDGSLLFSTSGNAKMIGGVTSKDEDLVRVDPLTGEVSLYFDGSDVGLNNRRDDINAVGMLDGDFLFSTTSIFRADGLKSRDEDIVRFSPSLLGQNTSGNFDTDLFFDGSAYGFNGDIAAVDFAI